MKSDFDEFLKDEGIYEEVNDVAIKRVIAYQLEQEMKIQKIIALNDIAKKRNQTLAQMALAWILKDKRITSVLIGASSVSQLNNNIESLQNLYFTKAELAEIECVLE